MISWFFYQKELIILQLSKKIMSYSKLIYHIIIRTKNSAATLTEDKENLLYKFIYGYTKSKKYILYRIGGMPNHIHLLVGLPPTIAVSDFVHDLKGCVTNFIQNHQIDFPLFQGWSRSYCALSYSVHEKEKIIKYIKGQKTHHQHHNLQNELEELLDEFEIAYDNKFFLKDWHEQK